jgi:uncharacterized protein
MARSRLVLAFLVASIVGVGSLTLAPAQDKKDKDKAPAGAYFEIYKDKSDEFRFRLKEDDTILAISGKGYKAKADVDKVIDNIKKDAAKAKVVDDTAKAK